MWTGFVLLKKGSSGGLLWTRDTFDFIKGGEFLDQLSDIYL